MLVQIRIISKIIYTVYVRTYILMLHYFTYVRMYIRILSNKNMYVHHTYVHNDTYSIQFKVNLFIIKCHLLCDGIATYAYIKGGLQWKNDLVGLMYIIALSMNIGIYVPFSNIHLFGLVTTGVSITHSSYVSLNVLRNMNKNIHFRVETYGASSASCTITKQRNHVLRILVYLVLIQTLL